MPKMNWLRLETRVRDALAINVHSYHDLSKLPASQLADVLLSIADIIGDETGRGYPLDDCFRDAGDWPSGADHAVQS